MTTLGRKPKLEPQDVAYAVAARDRGERMRDIAAYLGVSEGTLRRYLRGDCVHHRRHAA